MNTPNPTFIQVNPFAPEGDRLQYWLVRLDAIKSVHYGEQARNQCTLFVGGVGVSVTRESGDKVCDALGLVKPEHRS